MPRHRKTYPPEFQLEASRLVVEQGYSHQKAAERLGVSDSTIKNWVKKFREAGTLPPASQPVPEALELKRLRKENQRLEMEVAILKKAAAYFAKESL